MPAARAILLAAFLLAAPRRADADAPKPLPGTVGLVYQHVEVRDACATTFRRIKKVKRGDDAALVAALTYPRVTGLDFDPDKPARQKASEKKFASWFDTLTKRFTAARAVQEKRLTADGVTAPAKVEAIARLVLLLDQAVQLVEATELPPQARKDREIADIYCDRMREVAEPLRAQATDVRAACIRTIDDHAVPAGWWSEVCAAP